jgi:putative nucleotidyltransferase with HDIG domain
MLEKVFTKDLKTGMFVADLDRPWIDTPFLLQGFLVVENEQIAQLRQYCEFVVIDRQRSLGDAHTDKPHYKQEPNLAPDETRIVVQYRSQPEKNAGHATAEAPGNAPPVEPSATPAQTPPGNAVFSSSGRDQIASTATPLETEASGAAPAAATAAEEGWLAWIRNKLRFWGYARTGEHEPSELFADLPGGNGDSMAARASFLPGTVQITYYTDTRHEQEEVAPAAAAYTRANEVLHRMLNDIRSGGRFAIQEVEEVVAEMVDSMVRNPNALLLVARLREQDIITYGHSLQVAVYLVAFGRHLGFPKDYLARLGMVGLLLDIGKTRLPRELLEKKARLSEEEFSIIKEHVQLGLDILNETSGLHADVLEAVAQHHERENGSGYPHQLSGNSIGTFGRMAAIADSFAALINARPYAEAMSSYEALHTLAGWGGEYFHAAMVEQYIQAIGVFPVGSLIELSSGEVAIVVGHNRVRRLKPRVLVITGPDKSPSPYPAVRDLLYERSGSGEAALFIRRGLPAGAYGLDTRQFYVF